MMDSLFMSYALAEQGDSSSAEEVESPRSVVSAAAVRRRCDGGRRRISRHNRNQINNNLNVNETSNNSNNDKKCYLHSQVLRIKEEEMQIEEDLMGDFGIFNVIYVADIHPLDDVSSKIILPASPLGTKKNY